MEVWFLIEIVISIFLILGALLNVLGTFGILRLPDVYGRMHAATKSSTLGVICIMLAAFIFFISEGHVVLKILLTILFIFLTAPVVGLIVSRSAYNTNVKLWEKSVRDDLGEDIKKLKEKRANN